jgi:hypothetical protein
MTVKEQTIFGGALSGLLVAGAVFFSWFNGASAQQTVLTPVTSTFTQTTAATLAAIPANPSRRQLQICGTTVTNTLNFTFGVPAVTPTSALGIPLAAQTCVTYTPPPGEQFMGSQVNMIAITGSVVVVWTEWF